LADAGRGDYIVCRLIGRVTREVHAKTDLTKRMLFQSVRLVGAVGIEFIKAQNLKELCGMCCSRMSFVVLSRNYCCPRIAPAFL
jgi:hypothetical protein